MKGQNEQLIEFEPFVKFVVEFHNSSMTYAKLLRTKVQRADVFSLEDVEIIEEAFLIKHVAEWEVFVQNILTYCIAIDTSAISKHLELNLPKKIGIDNATAILNGLNFLTVSTTDELKGLAKRIITEECNPFAQFDRQFIRQIDELYILRNFVAHKSRAAKKKLMKMYMDKYGISDYIPPGRFLRQVVDDKPNAPFRSDLYYGAFMTISTGIWKYLDPVSYKAIFRDDSSREGYREGIDRMSVIFRRLTVDNNL